MLPDGLLGIATDQFFSGQKILLGWRILDVEFANF